MIRSENIPIEDIRFTQESERMDPKIVRRSMKLLKNGWNESVVPPLKGYFYTDGVYVTDGHHRYEAARLLGYDHVPVINQAAMNRGDISSYANLKKKYRKLIGHPLAK